MRLQLLVVGCILQSIHGSLNNSNESEVLISQLLGLTGFPFGIFNVVGGEDAPEGLAPFQCSLQSYGYHVCGCVVINSNFVLTASHCVETSTPDEVNIMVGSNDLTRGGTFFEAKRFISHEDYNKPRRANDIALVKVKGSIQFNENVQPIELEDKEVPEGSEVLLTGWGRLQAEGELPDKLQYVKLYTLQSDICRNTSVFKFGHLVQDSHICALSAKGTGACEHDSGGPLWTNNKKLVGISNFGQPCALGKPDVFAKISSFTGWISNHTST